MLSTLLDGCTEVISAEYPFGRGAEGHSEAFRARGVEGPPALPDM